MTKKYELSRRKALAGLGTIGVAAAGAGLGTSALFSDEESFTNNTIQAGTLNLVLKGGVIASTRENWRQNPDVAVAGANAVENDGKVELVLELKDVKPGDCYILHTDEVIEGNPSYLEMGFEELADKENGMNEPEKNESDPDPSGGELDDLMTITAWYGGSTVNENLVDPASVTCDNIDSASNAKLIKEQTLQSAFDGLAEFDANNPDDTSAHEAVAPHQTAISQDYVPGEPGTGPAPYEPNDLPPGTYRKFWELRLPRSVSNLAQSDSVKFKINARVEQARNNDTPFDSQP